MKFINIFFCVALISTFAVISFSQNPHDAVENVAKELQKNGTKSETKRAESCGRKKTV